MATPRTGAGPRLAGILERQAEPKPLDDDERPSDQAEGDGEGGGPAEASEPSRGRGGASRRPKSTAAKKAKGRTVYLDDALFERIIVQAHRKGRTISEYVSGILERAVPDHLS